MYLAFHILVVSLRAVAVYRGAPLFFEGVASYTPVNPREIARAVNYADIVLITATIGWLHQAHRKVRPVTPGRAAVSAVSTGSRPARWRPLNISTITVVAVAAMPYGIYTLMRYADIPGVDRLSATHTSTYAIFAITWPGVLLVALVYWHGFRPSLVVPLTGYLMIVGLQGGQRFRAVLPLILLSQIYLDRRGRRWPRPAMVGMILLLLLIFLPLKTIGREVQAGVPLSQVLRSTQSTFSSSAQGRSGDQVILDQLAMSLSLTDQYDRVFLGRPYLNLLYLPIPRSMWSSKPGLADHIGQISTPDRPMGKTGSVATLVGELYLNFRLFGLILAPYLLARITGRIYASAYQQPYLSVPRFTYLILACNMIQIFRDGLVSVPVFTLVHMLPLVVMALLHWRGPRFMRSGLDATAGQPDLRVLKA